MSLLVSPHWAMMCPICLWRYKGENKNQNSLDCVLAIQGAVCVYIKLPQPLVVAFTMKSLHVGCN